MLYNRLLVSFLYKVPSHQLEMSIQIPNATPALSNPGLVNMLRSVSFPAVLLWCFGLLVINSFSTPSTATLIHTNETDRLALLAIKSQFHDLSGATKSWNNSVPLCFWNGVSCGHRHQRVTKLDLTNQSIAGKLSPFIGNLSFLRSIHLADNSFYGEIPDEVSLLFRLDFLQLGNNSFSGTIPKNLTHCSNLITLAAYTNKLHGEIPREIGNLLKLENLDIYDNHLTGQLSPSIGNLSALEILDVSHNNLSGIIPNSLGQLRSLSDFGLAYNNLFGKVPPSIYNISSLTAIFLSFNKFYGSLPHNLGYNLQNLKYLSLFNNNFTGSLPNSLSNTSNLEGLDLANNYFMGEVLIDFSHLKHLSFLQLSGNNLGSGTINDLHFFTSLINCSKLEYLALAENQFGGVLSKFIGNFSSTITQIGIGFNQISGSIPSGIGNLVNLTGIGLEHNQLSGTIPHDIGKLKKLQVLYLYENSLQGSIPTSLGNMTLLIELALSSNDLQGGIPSSLGNCQNLMKLHLYDNKFNGILPLEILGITTLLRLDLSDNLLHGPFPSQLGNLKILLMLNISNNKFSGEIPSSLGSCTSLEELCMHDNFFNGSIPDSLASLKSIQVIDLSFNNLSDQIPKFLESLSFLKYLNLSYNRFEGEVPTKGVFSNKTGISLIGNTKLCGGFVEMHLPSCQIKRSRKSKISLVRVVLSLIISSLIVTAVCFIVIFTRRRRSTKMTASMLPMDKQFPMVSYAELSKATDKFSPSNMIGQGSYGLVYEGTLGEKRMLVAIKVINLQQKGGSKSFVSECEALRNVRHRNLIKIITVCSSIDPHDVDFKALVYEYMENGSLEKWLHQKKDQLDANNLSLIQRLNITIDVAYAIEYLHHHCEPPIIHGDLKPCNVLLDHDMVARVGDFGISKFLSKGPTSSSPQIESSSIKIKGTVGYIAPEYGMGSDMSISGDVYSFGILLLEMFIGKPPTHSMFDGGLTLQEFVKTALPERVMEIVEPSLLPEGRIGNNNIENFATHTKEETSRIKECLIGVLKIGVVCSMESPAKRMEMTNVVAKLCAVKEDFLGRRV